MPVITAPATAVVGVGKPIGISGVSLSETGNTTGETFTVTLVDTNGLLSATGTGITGSGTTTLTISGTLAQVNADLATLTDTDSNLAADTITLTALDSFGNTAEIGKTSCRERGQISMAAPSLTKNGVGKPIAISGVSLSETGKTTGQTFTVTLTDTKGLLSATGTGTTGPGRTTPTITGTLAQVNADLATLKDTDSNLAADTITLTALDSFGNTAAQKQIAVTVNGLPVITAPATATAGQGEATAIAGVNIGRAACRERV